MLQCTAFKSVTKLVKLRRRIVEKKLSNILVEISCNITEVLLTEIMA